MKGKKLYLSIIFLVIIILISIWYFTNKTPLVDLPLITPTEAVQNQSVEILPSTDFSQGIGDWQEEVWFKPVEQSTGEISFGSDGVVFTSSLEVNSRAGIMLNLNQDVSQFSKLTIQATITATDQTLPGTGFNGREAPVAIVVGYIDSDGIVHNVTSEDPTSLNNAFWRGFYFLEPTGASSNVNGVRVSEDIPYVYEYDLMKLTPKPQTIIFVALEGAGWRYRRGVVQNIQITGSN